MSNKVKDTDMKNHSYYFFDNIINIKNFDPNIIKIDEKSCKIVLINYIGHVTMKNLKYVIINSINTLYLLFSKVNVCFEEINKSKSLTLVLTNESREKFEKYKELQHKIRDLFRSLTKNSDDYDEKYMKIKFNSDDKLSLNKTT